MKALEIAYSAYHQFLLRDLFVEVGHEVLRDKTIAQVGLRSNSLALMLKIFVSEMEGEAGIYLAPLGTALGYREQTGWLAPWELMEKLSDQVVLNDSALHALRRMNPLSATCEVQLRAELDWFAANQLQISAVLL
ncbi:MAG: hypothetical protein ABIU07_01615 [Ramlibacter sp.]